MDHILEQLTQPSGSFVVEVEIHQIQYLLIQFVLNYLIPLYYFNKVAHVKLLTEEIFKPDIFCNIFSFLFYPFFFFFFCFVSDEFFNLFKVGLTNKQATRIQKMESYRISKTFEFFRKLVTLQQIILIVLMVQVFVSFY